VILNEAMDDFEQLDARQDLSLMAETFYDVEIALPRWATSCQLPDEVGHRPAAQKPACAYEAARSRPAEVRTGRSHFAFPASRICDVLYKCKRAACANKEAQTRKRERSELLAQGVAGALLCCALQVRPWSLATGI